MFHNVSVLANRKKFLNISVIYRITNEMLNKKNLNKTKSI